MPDDFDGPFVSDAGGVEDKQFEDIPPAPEYSPPEVTTAPKAKRGRKPFPRDANGNIIRPDGTIGKPRAAQGPRTVVPFQPILTDELVGRALGGASMLASIPGGPHWRLFPHEEAQLGQCLGPIARMYPDALAKWITMIGIVPVVAMVIVPRVKIQMYIMEGAIPKDKAREALLTALVMMEAEKKLDLSTQAKEAEAFLKGVEARAAAQVAKAA